MCDIAMINEPTFLDMLFSIPSLSPLQNTILRLLLLLFNFASLAANGFPSFRSVLSDHHFILLFCAFCQFEFMCAGRQTQRENSIYFFPCLFCSIAQLVVSIFYFISYLHVWVLVHLFRYKSDIFFLHFASQSVANGLIRRLLSTLAHCLSFIRSLAHGRLSIIS